MLTTIHCHTLEGFLALFGDTFWDRGFVRGAGGGRTLWRPEDADPPCLRGDPAKPFELKDFDQDVHKAILERWEKTGTTAMVHFENLELQPQKGPMAQALPVGPDWTYKGVEAVMGQHLGEVPSQFRFPTACVIKHNYEDRLEAVLVPTHGQPFVVYLPREDCLKHAQNCVDGYVEALYVPGREDMVLLVNEDGKEKQLPRNERACDLCHNRWKIGMAPEDWISGNMLIMGENREDGESADVPEDILAHVNQHRYGVQRSMDGNPQRLGINQKDMMVSPQGTLGDYGWHSELTQPGMTVIHLSIRRAVRFLKAVCTHMDLKSAAICEIADREGAWIRKAGLIIPVTQVI